LGSTSISQHVEYIAFGEVLFEEHSSSFSSPYLFNGKELDRETNLSYYGARYLDMKTSLWLNIDPLAEKYPNESPYIYCGNNPIAFIDPDGMDRIYSSSGRFIKDTGIGSKIMVQTKYGLRYLSGLDYESKGTRMAVSKVIAYEAHLRGNTGYYGVRNMEEEDTGAYTNSANTVWTNTKQLSKGAYDDYNDLGSTIDHEANLTFGHKGENRKNYTFVKHANVYLGQSQTKDFKNTSKNNKYSVATGYINRMYNAYKNKEISFEDLQSNVGNFNKLNAKNGVQILSKFDGNGVDIQVGGKIHPVHLKTLNNPED